MAKRRRGKLRVRRVIFAAVIVGMVAVSIATGIDQSNRLASLEEEEAQLTEILGERQLEKSRLEHMMDYAATDSYVEQVARSVLGWTKEDEIKFVAPEQPEN